MRGKNGRTDMAFSTISKVSNLHLVQHFKPVGAFQTLLFFYSVFYSFTLVSQD